MNVTTKYSSHHHINRLMLQVQSPSPKPNQKQNAAKAL